MASERLHELTGEVPDGASGYLGWNLDRRQGGRAWSWGSGEEDDAFRDFLSRERFRLVVLPFLFCFGDE